MASARTMLVLLLAAASTQTTGCVRRRMTIRSNPVGATVYIDDQQIGTTPVSTPYTYYGTRKIQLVKDGYETLTVKQKFKPPWYQIPPLDFFSENLVPYEFRDERIVDFEMTTQPVVPTQELLGRANQLRQATAAGYTVPVPPSDGATDTVEPNSALSVPPARGSRNPFYPPAFDPNSP